MTPTLFVGVEGIRVRVRVVLQVLLIVHQIRFSLDINRVGPAQEERDMSNTFNIHGLDFTQEVTQHPEAIW